jgi:hypothetical protein
VTAIANAVVMAGLSLTTIRDIVYDGQIILVTIITPAGRTITIEIDNRIVLIEKDNRTIY